jgi:hypothetical protein
LLGLSHRARWHSWSNGKVDGAKNQQLACNHKTAILMETQLLGLPMQAPLSLEYAGLSIDPASSAS